jgi:hypothetical protein
MTRRWTAAALLVLCAVVGVGFASSGSTFCQSVAVPVYSYPSPGSNPWSAAAAAQPGVGIMIANVTNGPGSDADPHYASAIARARAAGVAVFGYVYSSYATSSLPTVEAQIDAWSSLYGVTDIFVDEASTTVASEAYYEALTRYVHRRSSGSLTILNFGTTPPQTDMNAGDIVVTFEGDYRSYGATTFPSWVETYAPNRFYNIVYGVPTTAAMKQVMTEAGHDNVGNIYATDDALPNPYDTAPPYLSSEAGVAHSSCWP